MSEIFFTADTHLDHANVLRFNPGRQPTLAPGDLVDNGTEYSEWASPEIRDARCAEMNQWIVDTWNKTVNQHDIVYIVGDFAWKNHGRWIQALHGRKILIIGSHDKMSAAVLKNFTGVHKILLCRINNRDMTLCHWPMRTWQGVMYGSWCLTGHTHGRMQVCRPEHIGGGLILDVGWDVHRHPLHFEEVQTMMQRKKDAANYLREEIGDSMLHMLSMEDDGGDFDGLPLAGTPLTSDPAVQLRSPLEVSMMLKGTP